MFGRAQISQDRGDLHTANKQTSKQANNPISTGHQPFWSDFSNAKNHLRLAQTHIIRQDTALPLEMFVQ